MKKAFFVNLIISFLFISNNISAICQYPWIDLPKKKLGYLCRNNSEDLDEIDRLILSYHALDKTDKKLLLARIDFLNCIICTLNNKALSIEDEDLRTCLIDIKNQALGKKSYLESLYQLHERFSEPALNAHDYLSDIGDFPSDKHPLILNNKEYYDAKNAEFWGNYWLEIIDPAHRRLDTYFELWSNKKTHNPNLPPFFLWLEEQNVSRYIMHIVFLTDVELNAAKAKFENGLLYIKNSSGSEFMLVNTLQEEDEWIFIIDKHNEIYISKAAMNLRHPSLSHGKPIIGAGTIQVNNGIITKLSLESGHYLPQREHYIQTLQFFLDHNAQFAENLNISYYKNFKKYTNKLEYIIRDFFQDQ